MSVPSIVLLAVAIPAVLAGALLPPLLLHHRMETVSATFPEGLRESLGIGRERLFSVWDLAIFILLPLSSLAAGPVQETIAMASAILLAVCAASRSRAYFEARYEFSTELSGDARRILFVFGFGAGVFCVGFAVLAASLAFA